MFYNTSQVTCDIMLLCASKAPVDVSSLVSTTSHNDYVTLENIDMSTRTPIPLSVLRGGITQSAHSCMVSPSTRSHSIGMLRSSLDGLLPDDVVALFSMRVETAIHLVSGGKEFPYVSKLNFVVSVLDTFGASITSQFDDIMRLVTADENAVITKMRSQEKKCYGITYAEHHIEQASTILSSLKKADVERFRCRVCGSTDAVITQVQTRSGDEGMRVDVQCATCLENAIKQR